MAALYPRYTIPQSFRESARELKDPRSLAGAALFIALSIALSFFQIRVSNYLQIGFSFLATSMLGMLYGPTMGFLCGIIEDLLSFFLIPDGTFFLGYTITAALGGMIYGLFLYRCQNSIPRLILVKTCINLIVNILLGTCWVSIMYGKAFLALLPTRALKNLIALPFEVLLLFVVSNVILRLTVHLQPPAKQPKSEQKEPD